MNMKIGGEYLKNMNKYTLLLVDDEEEVIQIILKKINWEGLGFSVIGHADNGVKALEMVEEYQPDVVITDIKMPYMDGIELCKNIREEYPATKMVFFTGFDEFEYAKEAVHLEIEEYILKPLNAVELTNVLTGLKIKMDREVHDRKSAEILRAHYMESLPFLKANFYTSLVEGKLSEEEISKHLADYGIDFEGPYFGCLLIHTSSTQVPEDIDPQLLRTSVYKQVKEYLAERWKVKCFSYMENTVAIASLESEEAVSELTDDCDKFCRYIKRVLGAVVTIGVGQIHENIMELSDSYLGAREAISYRALYGVSRSINIKEIAPQEKNVSTSANDTELAQLFKMVRLGNEIEIGDMTRQYFKHAFSAETSLRNHHIAVMELVSALYRFAVNNDISEDEFARVTPDSYSKLFDLELGALENWLRSVCLFLHEMIVNARHTSTRTIVDNAKEYIRNNYWEEGISLDEICRTLGVSNSYFSTVFKRETGRSFVGYLTDYRMEKAARLLMETNEKSYVIGKKVGFADPNYFSYVFKRQFGVSPSKYRTEYEKRER